MNYPSISKEKKKSRQAKISADPFLPLKKIRAISEKENLWAGHLSLFKVSSKSQEWIFTPFLEDIEAAADEMDCFNLAL